MLPEETKETGRVGQLADSAEIAASLRITTRHLANLRAMRLIPFIRLGRLIRYDPTAVRAAVGALTVNPRAAGA
jgi:hypothetical protein